MRKTRRQLTSQGMLIKNRLMELNMTQRDLADKLQMGNGYLTDIIRGRRSGIKYMDRIFSELGIEGQSDPGSGIKSTVFKQRYTSRERAKRPF